VKQLHLKFNQSHIELKDYFLTQEAFEIKRDAVSGILKTLPQPDSVDRYYESEDYLSHSSERKSFFARCYDYAKGANLRGKLKLFQKYVKQGAVLDIGAGMGDLVRTLNENGFRARGVEPNAGARKAALINQVELAERVDQINHSKFAAVSMYHVLEHVPDITQQKQQIVDLLAPEGILILALPNYESLDAKWFGKHWAGYDVPRHLFHFNRNAVHYFFKDEFEIIGTHPLWFDSLYVSILSVRYKKWPLAFVCGIFIGLLSNLAAIFTKEYSSVTYVLKKRK
jgi:2-polyprenyl-3-methyl-5-hydroxy-6-metoxy-1,4-benzoquinol methylase